MHTRLTLALLALVTPSLAGAEVTSPADPSKLPSFDILSAAVSRSDGALSFRMTTSGTAGTETPAATGALVGAAVHAYVWPTSLDPATVGFEPGSGILALGATSHPDFDDTPLYDENGDGDPANDGVDWHSHWLVLVPSADCGPAALAVRDIPEGTSPQLPDTWPGLPLFIDSPKERPEFDGPTISVTIKVPGAEGAAFDGVTSALQVNANQHAPLLCVSDIFDTASGDLSLPGKID
jgi:hypothetical protein